MGKTNDRACCDKVHDWANELPSPWFVWSSRNVAEMPDPEADDTRREDEPGDWFVADFDGECSRNVLCYVAPGDTIRADGDGGWECRDCVADDASSTMELWEIRESADRVGGAA